MFGMECRESDEEIIFNILDNVDAKPKEIPELDNIIYLLGKKILLLI